MSVYHKIPCREVSVAPAYVVGRGGMAGGPWNSLPNYVAYIIGTLDGPVRGMRVVVRTMQQ